MLTLLRAIALLISISAGTAVYYGPGHDWDRIAENQGVQVPAGYTPIAHWDCNTLGRRGLLWLGDAEPLRIIVADCTRPEHIALVRSRDIVAEVPHEIAYQYGFVEAGRIKCRLWLERTNDGAGSRHSNAGKIEGLR